MIGIYKITNPNGRIYIGQSVNIERRMRSYVNVSKQVSSSVKLYRSLKKHTFDNHLNSLTHISKQSIDLPIAYFFTFFINRFA